MSDSDIDPRSGNRLPPPRREDLDATGQRIYDEISAPGSTNIRGLRGPAGIHLHSPQLSALLRPLNRYLRIEAGLTPRVRETAILSAARACDSQFEWAAHEKEALKHGVPQATVDAIKHRAPTDGLDETDAVIVELCRASFVTHHVPPELYARALAIFGPKQLVDLVVLMGYYIMTAGMLTAFDMQLDPGQDPLLPVG
jgi:4-carboxymuconolactone decarboxylase